MNLTSANQMYGSNNAPLGIILCKSGKENARPFALMSLPDKVMILHPDKEDEKQGAILIDPNLKIY